MSVLLRSFLVPLVIVFLCCLFSVSASSSLSVEDDTNEFAYIDSAAVVTEKSPMATKLSEHFKGMILKADQSHGVGMEEWINYAWNSPYDQVVENQLHILKQSAQIDQEDTSMMLKYISLLTAQAFRQSIIEIPADIDSSNIITHLKTQLENKFRPLQHLLSELNGASIDLKHLYEQYFANIQTEGLCPTTHTSSRYTRYHHSNGYASYHTGYHVPHQQPYYIYYQNMHYQPFHFENQFMQKAKKPSLTKILNYVMLVGRIACSAVCLAHGIPVLF